MFLLLVLSTQQLNAQERGWYGGVGFGPSSLEPDDSGSPYILEETNSMGYKLELGYEWNNSMSAEVFFADLGEAGFQNDLILGYNAYGISSTYKRKISVGGATSMYIKGGVSDIKNSGNVPFINLDNNLPFLAGGIQLDLANNYFVKAEYTSFQKDAQLLQISINKRFGHKQKTSKWEGFDQLFLQLNAGNFKTKQQTIVSSQKITDPDLLTQILGEIGGLEFISGSYKLTLRAKEILNEYAIIINRHFPDLKFLLVGHTDDIGDEKANKILSQNQVARVLDYLSIKGVDSSNFKIQGEGEMNPQASTNTPEGRERNRRMELFLQY